VSVLFSKTRIALSPSYLTSHINLFELKGGEGWHNIGEIVDIGIMSLSFFLGVALERSVV